MNRIVFLLIFVVGTVSPSRAAPAKTEPVTVAQLDQWLASARGQSDGKIAKNLESMEITERVNPAQLARWEANLPGRRSREELTAIADATVLLSPPPAEILSDAPPDRPTQSAILSRANDYVAKTLAKLPDFHAVRTTEHFDDTPVHKVSDPFLHFTGESTDQVSYRDGLETQGEEKADSSAIHWRMPDAAPGIASAGEFGPILSVVLDDATHGSIQWGYWEQSPQGRLAVFRYSVPKRVSNFLLSFTRFFRVVNIVPAYLGEFAIDPATGAILRISIFTSSELSVGILESAITVYYGAVQLGGKNYICPLRGLALMKTLVDNPQGGTGLRTYLNDSAFTGYHLMRGDITILPNPQ